MTTFRRINGHVVPIADKENQTLSSAERKQRLAKGTAQVAGGLGTAAATGAVASQVVKGASGAHMKARTQFRVARAQMQGDLHTMGNIFGARRVGDKMRGAAKLRRNAQRVFKMRNPLLAAGALAAGGLLTSGAINVREGATGKKTNASAAAKIATVATTAGTVGTAAAYYSKLSIGGPAKVAANAFARAQGRASPHKASWWKRGK